MTDLTEQPEPEPKCPTCGSDPKPDPRHHLSALGYLHDDIAYSCSDEECGEKWTHGVPVGSTDGKYAAELRCDVCKQNGVESFGLTHRVQVKGDREGKQIFNFHMKCPKCYNFWHMVRKPGAGNVALVGYPQITGDVENAEKPYGYDDPAGVY